MDKDIKKPRSISQYIVRILDGMARGLFASLIIGLIIKQIGTYAHIDLLVRFGQTAQYLLGPAIGVGVALSVGCSPLGVFASAVTGAIGAGTLVWEGAVLTGFSIGEPVGALLAALAGAEASRLIAGRTKVDIILVPFVTILIGGLVGVFLAPVVAAMMRAIGAFINTLTTLYPLPMGILVSVVVGMVLTLPISSAAICISLGISGLAAGAATVGCCSQMVGFAVASWKDNKVGGLISQGLGTSMLQMPNIVKNWKIWIPPTLTAALLGPLSTLVFKMENNAAGAGMGTSGLVGQFNTLAVMGPSAWWKILVLHVALPAVLTALIAAIMRSRGWIKLGDMKLA
ncbi:MAG: PTS sugar transporter subunit IIC [Sphaerochaetaceae bacterium]|nr:PTS sugar transporter subunit IIC [Sphaerochaetaceae bacterium]NLO59480.1 PTS sugar transporter subunit IIC [Spirochaetales bacterium]MDD2405245.1 PTS sugar transporter subunit IIC [Sphaerochaetaceae bacterium]MDD3670216.1 PTS sugar transporter subunit IIC [Sphaerochaetaceae bacterium]MDD4259151.1 PTS sugar transporter subunit IIC [Sphaerochaetaceae bacterium]